MKLKHLLTIMVLLLAAVILSSFLRNTGGPKRHSAEEEELVGTTIADLIGKSEAADQAVIVYLYPKDKAPYDARASQLRQSLLGQGSIVEEVWTKELGLYNDDDYTACLDYALETYPAASTLVVVSVGSVTHAQVSKPMQSFLKEGGALYMVGSVGKDTPYAKLAERGYVTILARRTLWLKDNEHEALSQAPDYVRQHFTILGKTS